MEMALNLRLEDKDRKHGPVVGSILFQKALSPSDHFKLSTTDRDQPAKELKAISGWVNSFDIRFSLKNV